MKSDAQQNPKYRTTQSEEEIVAEKDGRLLLKIGRPNRKKKLSRRKIPKSSYDWTVKILSHCTIRWSRSISHCMIRRSIS